MCSCVLQNGKMDSTLAIPIGFVLGIIVGHALLQLPNAVRTEASTWLKLLGDIFVRLIWEVILPLIFFTVAAATASIADLRKLGIILVLMMMLYVFTSVHAAVCGVLAGLLFAPGVEMELTPPPGYTLSEPSSGVCIVLSFFQLDFNLLLTVGGAKTMIVFSIITGVATVLLGEEGRKVYSVLVLGYRTMINVVRVIMYYAPVAIFSYAA